MKEIHSLEILENFVKIDILTIKGINPAFFWAYKKARKEEWEELNFEEVIWDNEIEQIAENLRRFNIHSFTISSTFSGLIATLAKFEEQGFKLAGLTKAKASYDDWQTGERAIIPAVRLTDVK